MYITITIEAGGKRFDLSIDERGSAASAYAILKEKGMIAGAAKPSHFKSMLLGEWIDAKKPLLEQGVVSGDLLSAPALR